MRRKRELCSGEDKPKSPLDVAMTPRLRLALIRIIVIAAITFCVCKWLCMPVFIKGASMEPTYPSLGFNFCWIPAYAFSKPKPGEIVVVKYGGVSAMLLKRVAAVAGQTLEFRKGELYVDGVKRIEPYVKGPCDWELSPRKVAEGCIYIIGDNRSMPIGQQIFGEVSLKKVKGAPLW